MDLTITPWVPIIRPDGFKETISLRSLFEESDRIRDLSANPPQRISLMRFLICITQAALDGPANEDEWYRCREQIQPATISYLKKLQLRFNLFGDRPFLQATNLKPIDNATLDKLDFTLAAGNNAVLFDHEATPMGRTHSPGWCAGMLLTFQCYSPGGLIGTTTWDTCQTARASEHAPALEGSALHTFIRGKNLLETIWLNTLTREMIKSRSDMTFGHPVWEDDRIASGRKNQLNAFRNSYLGRLVPLSRAIILNPDKSTMTLSNGLAYPKLPKQREPCATVVQRGKGDNRRFMYIPVDLTRHPWRELPSILSQSTSTGTGGALALGHLGHLKQQDRLELWTGGMAADRGKILDVAEWQLSLPVILMQPSNMAAYRMGLTLAQSGELRLKEAVKAWYKGMAVDANHIPYRKALGEYWAILDQRYERLLTSIQNNQSLRLWWYDTVCHAMESSYKHACPHHTPRQIQTFALASQRLTLKKPNECSLMGL